MLTSIPQIKAEGNLPDSIDDRILEPHIIKAEIEIKRIITAEKYLAIEALGKDDENYIMCAIAEANLALAFAWPSLNTETQGTGIVRVKGWDQSRSELISQSEIAAKQEHNRHVAMDLLKPFIMQSFSSDETSSDEVRGADYRLSAV